MSKTCSNMSNNPIWLHPKAPSDLEHQLDALLADCLNRAPIGNKGSGIKGIRLFWTSVAGPPAPVIYEPGIVLILRGSKQGSLGSQTLHYDRDTYLVFTLPTHLVCTTHASEMDPLCGLFLSINRDDLTKLIASMAEVSAIPTREAGYSVSSGPVTDEMRSTIKRIFDTIGDPVAGNVIGPSLRQELLFHILRGPCGPDLAALLNQGGEHILLENLIQTIRKDITSPISVETMAQRTGMSLSTFHRAFRNRTGQTPLQYVKKLRLHAAREMIAYKGTRVSEAALSVGYESCSQFTREYKGLFGETPREARNLVLHDTG
ncbi:AraC family transcriptional regulator [uncultured Cohaesibacter sp.]|uniref:AraC family transcriptional regulator n=1 Tax=uncultured Cohaesibacter sp. TaxID=1002546 RepID=UPI00292F6B74|nr:AraC family transcriptional regulator [uncultured Cohaesibacter sp.]